MYFQGTRFISFSEIDSLQLYNVPNVKRKVKHNSEFRDNLEIKFACSPGFGIIMVVCNLIISISQSCAV